LNLFTVLSVFPSNDDWSNILGFDSDFIMGILFQFVNVGVIIFVLTWLLYSPVKDFLNNRKERIAKEIEDASQNLKHSQETKATYESKLANVSVERDEILDAARKMANERELEIVTGANNEASLILDRARREIEQEREKAKDEIRNQIIHVSSIMAEQLMQTQLNVDDTTKDRLLNQAIAELGDAAWKN
jgi:F-type H+-transporting ATPase subunit b